MTTGRSNACTVLLPDGNLLISGGNGQDGALSSAEFFSPDGRFHAAPPMMDARSGHACAMLADGRVLVAGGRTSGGAVTNAVEFYDAKSMTWKPGPSLVEARAGATVSVLKDSRILIAGGDTSAGVSDSMEIYDARTGSFSQVRSKLSSPRREHAASVMADGRVLIAGGFDGSKALDTADLFDPRSGGMVSAGKLNVPRAGLSATTLLGGRVLIAGGSNGKNEIGVAEVFDPKSGEFKIESSLMITPRRDHSAVRIPGNNTVVLVGGTLAGQPLSQTEIYIPWRHRFQAAGDMQFAKTGMIAGSLKQRGKLMIAGGRNAAGTQANAETISLPTITTDKADYAPGTPVVFSGSGWIPNQPVKIVMVESPDIDRPDAITTMADAYGNISDSSFAPDQMDIGITFYVTATQEGPLDANGQPTILTAQTSFTDAANLKFTDGAGNVCGNGSSQYQSAAAAAPFGQKICASATGLGNGSTTVTVGWIQPNSSTVFYSTIALSNGNFQDIEAPNASGQWTVNVYTDGTLATLLGTGSFYVGPFAGGLRFTTGPFSVLTNSCSPANTIQLQDASNVPITVSFPTTVNLNSSSGGTFYSDPSCATPTASVEIPGNQSNTSNFYYKDGVAGTPMLTGAATGIANSATQVEAITGPATHLLVSAPASSVAGSAFPFTVTAQDASNNTVTAYSGTVHFTSNDSQAVLPANATLTNGVGTFTATLKTAGSRSLTATDTANASITGTATITVGSGSATRFTVSAPATATAGTAFGFTVTAFDAFDNIATGYAGTVTFSSSDAQAALPGSTTLTNGVGSFQATLKTAGTQTLTASDGSIAATSGPIAVSAGAATQFTVSAPGSATAGAAFTFTVTAKDTSGNTASGYSGTAHFTSTDGQAVLPGDATLSSGVGTFSATLKTAGSQTLTATDTLTPSIAGTSSPITVSAGSATTFSVTAPSTATAGTSFSFAVTARDAFNNIATGYSGTVHFTTTDGQAVLPLDSVLTSGAGTFSATLRTAGGQSLTATDTVTISITGTSVITVSAGTATNFTVSAPASATAGAAFPFTVTAKDASGNIATGYTGTVHFASSDGLATVPVNTTLTNGAGIFSATLRTAAVQTLTATDTVSPITGTTGPIAVSAGSATHFTVTAPSSSTAGAGVPFTVTALDAFNNTVTGYAGTVHFTSSDNQATLPTDATLTNGAGTFSATFKTAGSQTVTATDIATPSTTGTSNPVAVSAGSATHFAVSAPASATANSAFPVTVTALDAFNNTANGYAGTVHFTSSDGQAVLPANSGLTNGAGSFSVTLKTVGSQTVSVNDTANVSMTGTSGPISVGAGSAAYFAVSAPASATAGSAFSFTVTAQDAVGNTVTSYSGTVHFSSSDGQAVLPTNATLTGGTGNFSATMKTAGSQTITATDTVLASMTGTAGIAVSAGSATHFTVSAPASSSSNSAFPVTVTALDDFNNTATGYTGTIHFTSTDGQALLPTNSTLTNGVGSFSATLKTAGNQTVTATDTVNVSMNGTSAPISVSAGSANQFTVSAPASATAGTAFNFTVTAKDSSGNTATGYTGTVHFTSSDAQAVLPTNATLTNGFGTFSATLKTAGSQTITATDTVVAAMTGTSTTSVSAGSATHFTLVTPNSITANSPFSMTVTAMDDFNNVATGYTGTVHFTSTDGQAVLPQDSTLTNGVGIFQVTLKTAGSQTVTATDTVNSSITATSSVITVSAGSGTRFTVSAPASATAGSAFTFTVTAQDSLGNTATGYSGTVHFTSNDGQAVLPDNATLTNGVGTFSATLKTAGSRTITATDTVTPSITGTSNTVATTAAAANHFTVISPSSATANSAVSVTVTALDPYNNIATGYTGTVHFTSSDAQAILPTNSPLTNGTGTFPVTLKTVGSQTVTATDTVTPSLTGTTSAIAVSAGTATHFTVSTPASATAGTSFSFTVTAFDASNLTATGYTGTVHFTSSDSHAVLPADATLTNGVGTFTATLKTAGSRTITATDSVNASITGTSNTTAVSAGSATNFIISVPPSPDLNSPFSVTVTAVDAYGNPVTNYSGTVQFTSTDSQAILPANYTFVAGDNGTHTFTATLKTSGTQSITVSDGSATGAQVLTVGKAPSSVTLTASTNNPNLGQTVLFTATVAPADATGTVTFLDGTTNLGAATLNSGVAVFNISTLPAGSHLITATYEGNAKYLSSTTSSALSLTVQDIPSPVVVTFTSSNNPASAGSPTILTVTVISNNSTNPTGSVQFFDNSKLVATVPLVNGQANLSVTLDPGVHNLSATYNGNLPPASTVYGQYVTKVSTSSFTVVSSLPASTVGQPITLTATAQIPSQTPGSVNLPTGEVQFYDGSVLIGTGKLVNGVASITVSNLTGGGHQITATYVGDGSWNTASTKPITQMVQRLQSITGLRYVPVTGGVRLMAKVTATGTPTGTVQILEASSQTVLGTMPLNSTEVGMGLRPERVKPGMKLVAVYSGDVNYAGSSSPVLTAAPVLNAASYSGTGLAPDAIATIFGTGYVRMPTGTDSGSDSDSGSGSENTPSEANLAQPTVRILDSAGIEYSAVLFFVSPNQINFLMPSKITLGPALVTVTDFNGVVSLGSFTIDRVSPGMFSANSTGEGAGSAWMIRVHKDGSQDPRVNVATYDFGKKSFVPAVLSLDSETDKLFLEVYVTGIRHGSNVSMTINGQNAPTLYTGAHGQFPGLDQINVELPASLKGAGEVNLQMTVDGQISNVVTVIVQ